MKKAMRGLCLVCGGALLCNGILVSLISNLNFGTLLVFGLGGALLLCGLLYQRLWKWLRFLVLSGAAVLVLLCACLSFYGSVDTVYRDPGDRDADVLVVLGCGVRGDRVSVGLARRLDKAIQYRNQFNPDVLIVVSGGQGPQETVTEAEAMRRYLVACGVPDTQIIKEEQATSTLENLQFSDALLRERFPDGCKTALVTSSFHVFRAERIARKLGLDYGTLGASSIWYTVPMNNLRELCAIAHEILRGTI